MFFVLFKHIHTEYIISSRHTTYNIHNPTTVLISMDLTLFPIRLVVDLIDDYDDDDYDDYDVVVAVDDL